MTWAMKLFPSVQTKVTPDLAPSDFSYNLARAPRSDSRGLALSVGDSHDPVGSGGPCPFSRSLRFTGSLRLAFPPPS